MQQVQKLQLLFLVCGLSFSSLPTFAADNADLGRPAANAATSSVVSSSNPPVKEQDSLERDTFSGGGEGEHRHDTSAKKQDGLNRGHLARVLLCQDTAAKEKHRLEPMGTDEGTPFSKRPRPEQRSAETYLSELTQSFLIARKLLELAVEKAYEVEEAYEEGQYETKQKKVCEELLDAGADFVGQRNGYLESRRFLDPILKEYYGKQENKLADKFPLAEAFLYLSEHHPFFKGGMDVPEIDVLSYWADKKVLDTSDPNNWRLKEPYIHFEDPGVIYKLRNDMDKE
ncbi:MAG: hypothetical protein RLZ12_948, partial [Bacillota bacterium]